MVLGGIPYYLSLLDHQQSLPANIDRLFFGRDAEMKKEFDRLFKALFKSPQAYVDIIQLLAANKKGLTRKEISEKLKKETGGHLSKLLENLENCDFIRKYNVRERKINSNNGIYQLTDFYIQFYHDFAVSIPRMSICGKTQSTHRSKILGMGWHLSDFVWRISHKSRKLWAFSASEPSIILGGVRRVCLPPK